MDKGHPRRGDMRQRNGINLAVIGFIVFFFSIQSWGADWKFIAQDIQDSIWEIDVTSISRQPNNIARVSVKQTHSKESVIGWIKQYGEQYKNFLSP
jgi:hypothetical protein